jgi:hypothetical protein
MSRDRSGERRQLAAARLIFAKQMSGWKIRPSVLGMTQRWLDWAEPREPDALDKALRLRAIQTKIGQELRAQYELPEEQTHGILTLLIHINIMHRKTRKVTQPRATDKAEPANLKIVSSRPHNGARLWRHGLQPVRRMRSRPQLCRLPTRQIHQ